jgi:hypothetical protein
MHFKSNTRAPARKPSSGTGDFGSRGLRLYIGDARRMPPSESAAPSDVARHSPENEKAASKFETAGATVQPLNGIEKTVKPLNSSTVKPRRLSWQDENFLLDEIRLQFERAHGKAEAKSEMSRSGAHWRKVCRNFPDELESAVGELRHRLNDGMSFRTRAWFWLMKEVLIYIGADDWPSAWEKSKESL